MSLRHNWLGRERPKKDSLVAGSLPVCVSPCSPTPFRIRFYGLWTGGGDHKKPLENVGGHPGFAVSAGLNFQPLDTTSD